MSINEYTPIPQRDRSFLFTAVKARDPLQIADGLMSVAYWDSDWRWAQDQLVSFAEDPDDRVLWAVASGFGLIAAFHGEMDLDVVEPILRRLKGRPQISVAAENSLDEIGHFVRKRKQGNLIDLAARLVD